MVVFEVSVVEGLNGCTHTTICLRPSSGLRMNLRVRRVTWPSDMMAVVCVSTGRVVGGRCGEK